MSHTLECEVQFKDPDSIIAACRQLNLPVPERGPVELYDGASFDDGFAVQLKGWHYPLAIDAKTGVAKYDNYNGRWGKTEELHRFTQCYAEQAAMKVVRQMQQRGQVAQVQRVVGANGSIQLRIQVK